MQTSLFMLVMRAANYVGEEQTETGGRETDRDGAHLCWLGPRACCSLLFF